MKPRLAKPWIFMLAQDYPKWDHANNPFLSAKENPS